MFAFTKSIIILLLTTALNLQAVVMPASCDCAGITRLSEPACRQTHAAPVRSCCAGKVKKASSDAAHQPNEFKAGNRTVPPQPGCLCCPSRRAEAVKAHVPAIDFSRFIVAILPDPVTPVCSTDRLQKQELLACIWPDDIHGNSRQARLSVWLN